MHMHLFCRSSKQLSDTIFVPSQVSSVGKFENYFQLLLLLKLIFPALLHFVCFVVFCCVCSSRHRLPKLFSVADQEVPLSLFSIDQSLKLFASNVLLLPVSLPTSLVFILLICHSTTTICDL